MLDVWWQCRLDSAHWQQGIEATLCWLLADYEAFQLVPGWLPFLAIVAVIRFEGPEILRYWEWGPNYV